MRERACRRLAFNSLLGFLTWAGAQLPTASAQLTAEDSLEVAKLEQRHERSPRNREVRIELAKRYLAMGRGQQAADLVDGYLTTRHASPTLYSIVALGNALSGKLDVAHRTLTTGIAAYPYSEQLYRARLNLGLAEGRHRSPEALLALPDSVAPQGVRLELAAGMALDSGRLVDGLLHAEHAYYLLGHDFDANLAVRVREVYDRMLNAQSRDWDWGVTSYPDTSWRALYLSALQDATKRVLESELKFENLFETYAALRVATLRMFAARGGLALADEPLLVDLYVMDRAGHLDASTSAMLGTGSRFLVDRLNTTYGEAANAADLYIAERWAQDVDAYLEQSGL